MNLKEITEQINNLIESIKNLSNVEDSKEKEEQLDNLFVQFSAIQFSLIDHFNELLENENPQKVLRESAGEYEAVIKSFYLLEKIFQNKNFVVQVPDEFNKQLEDCLDFFKEEADLEDLDAIPMDGHLKCLDNLDLNEPDAKKKTLLSEMHNKYNLSLIIQKVQALYESTQTEDRTFWEENKDKIRDELNEILKEIDDALRVSLTVERTINFIAPTQLVQLSNIFVALQNCDRSLIEHFKVTIAILVTINQLLNEDEIKYDRLNEAVIQLNGQGMSAIEIARQHVHTCISNSSRSLIVTESDANAVIHSGKKAYNQYVKTLSEFYALDLMDDDLQENNIDRTTQHEIIIALLNERMEESADEAQQQQILLDIQTLGELQTSLEAFEAYSKTLNAKYNVKINEENITFKKQKVPGNGNCAIFSLLGDRKLSRQRQIEERENIVRTVQENADDHAIRMRFLHIIESALEHDGDGWEYQKDEWKTIYDAYYKALQEYDDCNRAVMAKNGFDQPIDDTQENQEELIQQRNQIFLEQLQQKASISEEVQADVVELQLKKAAFEQAKRAKEVFCSDKNTFVAYTTWLKQDEKWLDVEILKVGTEVQGIPLCIWHEDPRSKQLEIFYLSPGLSAGQEGCRHLLYNRRNHFDILMVEAPTLSLERRLSPSNGSFSPVKFASLMTHEWSERNDISNIPVVIQENDNYLVVDVLPNNGRAKTP